MSEYQKEQKKALRGALSEERPTVDWWSDSSLAGPRGVLMWGTGSSWFGNLFRSSVYSGKMDKHVNGKCHVTGECHISGPGSFVGISL